MRMGIRRMGMGIKMWAWKKNQAIATLFLRMERDVKFHMLEFYSNITWSSFFRVDINFLYSQFILSPVR